MNLNKKVCLVTGASGGIGSATVLALAGRGADIAAFGRRQSSEILAIKDQVSERGGRFYYGTGDVAEAQACSTMVGEAARELGAVDVIVHCAGGAAPGTLLNVEPEQWHRAFDVHLHSIFYLCRAAVPHMKKRGGGAVVLISSAAGLRGVTGAIAYSTAKGAIPQMVRSLARELADDGIRVNAVAPGVIRTPFQNYLTAEQVENNIKNRIPVHREGTPEDVAEAILTLLTNDFITGETLTVDGGMTMRIV